MTIGAYPKYERYEDTGVEWSPKIPSHWTVKALKYGLRIKNGQDHKNVLADQGYPVYGSGGQFAFASEYLYDGEAILLGRKGTIDRPLHVTGKFWSVDTMFYAICNSNLFPRFAYYYATTIPFSYFSTSTALPSMTQDDLKNSSIALPPIPEQRAIAAFLDSKTAAIDQAIEITETQIALLKEHKQIIIQNAVTKGLNPDTPMKDSGIDWIGKIPLHWDTLPLRANFRFRNEKNDPIRTENILSLSIAHGVTEYSDEGRGGNKRKEDITAYKLAYEGDIVLNSMNVIVGAVGRSKYFGAISPVYYALFPLRSDVYVPYFENIFLNSGFQRGLLRFGKGILIKFGDAGKMNTIRMKISTDDLKNLPFPIPPDAEQNAIVSHINIESSKIEATVELKKRQIESLKEYKATLINAAVTGKIKVI